MGGSCDTYGRHEICIQGFLGRDMRERDHLEDTDKSGRIILRWISGKWVVGGMEWFDLAQDRGYVVDTREGGNEILVP